jgi:Dyp-type peroxidase family
MGAFNDDQLKNIQGMGIAGFRKDRQQLLFVTFPDASSGQRLLQQLGTLVASAYSVGKFNDAFSEIRKRMGENVIEATWIGVLLSAKGYRKLGVDLNELPSGEGSAAFIAGMASRAQQVGDTRPTDSSDQWLSAFRRDQGVDALIVIASDDDDDFNERITAINNLLSACGCEVEYQERGNTLPSPHTGHEHFGFKDGLSQPAIDGYDAIPALFEPPVVKAGEFVLGYQDEAGQTAAIGDLWVDGSFVPFRRLRQNVAAFRAMTATQIPGANPPISSEQLAGKMVGRWPSGAPLELNPDTDPGDSGVTNAFQYATAPFSDADGSKAPTWAHIRKANPRDEPRPDSDDPVQRHRMIRRGIPFGQPLPAGAADDGAERGLHFIAFVADLDRQFEFVQRKWLNDRNFPVGVKTTPGTPYAAPTNTPGDGVDPIVGQHDTGDQDLLHQTSGAHAFALPAEVVSVSAGEYFFAPSVSAIVRLGQGATSSTPKSTTAASGPAST